MGIVIVTGASRGIGKSTAELLLSSQTEVHGTYCESRAEAEAMVEQYDGLLTMHHADFADPDGVSSLVGKLSGLQVDGLVNNAGTFQMDGFADWDVDVWRTVFEINLHAPVMLAMALKTQYVGKGPRSSMSPASMACWAATCRCPIQLRRRRSSTPLKRWRTISELKTYGSTRSLPAGLTQACPRPSRWKPPRLHHSLGTERHLKWRSSSHICCRLRAPSSLVRRSLWMAV